MCRSKSLKIILIETQLHEQKYGKIKIFYIQNDFNFPDFVRYDVYCTEEIFNHPVDEKW